MRFYPFDAHNLLSAETDKSKARSAILYKVLSRYINNEGLALKTQCYRGVKICPVGHSCKCKIYNEWISSPTREE